MDAPTESLKKYDSQRTALAAMKFENRNSGYTPISICVIGDYISEWSYHEDTNQHTYAPYRIILEKDIHKSINETSVRKGSNGRYLIGTVI